MRTATLALALLSLAACAAPDDGARDADAGTARDADAPALDAPAPDAGPPWVGRDDWSIRHRFLAVDNGRSRLLLVDQIDASRGWAVSIRGGSRDLQLLDGGDRVLVSHFDGASERALADGAELWSIDGFLGVQSARRLSDGNTLLAMNAGTDLVLRTVDPSGAELSRVTIPDQPDVRLARVLESGHVLVGLADPHRLIEIDRSGAVVWSAELPGKGYVGIRAADGTTYATTGGDARIVQLDATGALIASWGGRDAIPELPWSWLSGLEVRPDGHLVAAHWLGHGATGTGPHAIELDASGALVWEWTDFDAADTITNLVVLE